MQIRENVALAGKTAFGVGGPAEKLALCHTTNDVQTALSDKPSHLWVLGYGTNILVSDKGLPGLTLLVRDGAAPSREENVIIADAAASWDDVVSYSIDQELWGLELMSGIPGNVGAACTGNIAAYGQKVADTFVWAEVLDPKTGSVKKLAKSDIDFSYRATSLQDESAIVLRVAFELSDQPTRELDYASARKVAEELGLETSTLGNRRQIILETRRRAGSIYDEKDASRERTAGSFFKNPIVDRATAIELASFEEFGRTEKEILEQSRLMDSDKFRATATHVLLAAGFKRGQAWGPVRLHPKHILKIENAGSATAQQIYDAAQDIMRTVKEKLDIELEPEVRFLGDFS